MVSKYWLPIGAYRVQGLWELSCCRSASSEDHRIVAGPWLLPDTLHCSAGAGGSAVQFNSSVSAMPSFPPGQFAAPSGYVLRNPRSRQTCLLTRHFRVISNEGEGRPENG